MKYIKKFNESISEDSLKRIAIKQLKNHLINYGCIEDFGDEPEKLGIDCETTDIILNYRNKTISQITISKIVFDDGTIIPLNRLRSKDIIQIFDDIKSQLDAE